jgi:hypothetical protein
MRIKRYAEETFKEWIVRMFYSIRIKHFDLSKLEINLLFGLLFFFIICAFIIMIFAIIYFFKLFI